MKTLLLAWRKWRLKRLYKKLFSKVKVPPDIDLLENLRNAVAEYKKEQS